MGAPSPDAPPEAPQPLSTESAPEAAEYADLTRALIAKLEASYPNLLQLAYSRAARAYLRTSGES